MGLAVPSNLDKFGYELKSSNGPNGSGGMFHKVAHAHL